MGVLRTPLEDCLCRLISSDPSVSIYSFQVNKRNTRAMCKICSNVTIKRLQRPPLDVTPFWCLFVNLTLYIIQCSGIFIVDFERSNAGWVSWIGKPGHSFSKGIFTIEFMCGVSINRISINKWSWECLQAALRVRKKIEKRI